LKVLIFFLALIAGTTTSGKAQEMHGYVNSNYAGITGSLINPSSLITSKVYLDINVLGLHVNADNNYVYLSKNDFKFSNFLSLSPQLPRHEDPVMGGLREYYDRYNTNLKHAFSQVRLLGPSAMFATGNQAFGLSTSYRVIASGNDIPYDLAKFALEGISYYPQHRINYTNEKDFRLASLAMAEISGSYSRILYRHNREYYAAGISLKGLFATAGAFGFVDNIDYMIPNSDDIVVYNANGRFGTSLPIDYNNNDVLIPGQLFSGKGFGLDIGFTYQKMEQGHSTKAYSAYCEIPYQPYKFRLGVSLLDLGSVRFKKNPVWMNLKNSSAYWKNVGDENYASVNELFSNISREFTGDELNYTAFAIGLPTALSIQFDYHVNKNIYVNSIWVQPVIMSDASVVRPAQLSVTPRFETNHFEIALPVILYEYKYPRIGLSARFYKIIIGTDKLGSFFGMNDFTGMDFYLMLKFQFFKGTCRGFKKKTDCGNLEYKQQY